MTESKKKFKASELINFIYYTLLSLFLWFNLYITPAIMLFPELNEKLSVVLWANEVAWVLEIVRKMFFNAEEEEEDASIAALKYIKSTLILDVLATLP